MPKYATRKGTKPDIPPIAGLPKCWLWGKCKKDKKEGIISYIQIKKWTVATVQVVYYIPDYLHIVNEFMWQTEDQLPEYPRITKFLNYWDKNIDGPIKEVYIYDQGQSSVRHVNRKYKIN